MQRRRRLLGGKNIGGGRQKTSLGFLAEEILGETLNFSLKIDDLLFEPLEFLLIREREISFTGERLGENQRGMGAGTAELGSERRALRTDGFGRRRLEECWR